MLKYIENHSCYIPYNKFISLCIHIREYQKYGFRDEMHGFLTIRTFLQVFVKHLIFRSVSVFKGYFDN